MDGRDRRSTKGSRGRRVRAPWMGILALAAVALWQAGCGGGSSYQTSTSSGGPPPPPPSTVLPCVTGTVASYIGTSCSQSGTVYHWTSYSCTSTPSSICDTLGVNGANVAMAMDSSGKGPYTILVGETPAWDVIAGQNVDVVISGTVYGAYHNDNWPHFRGLRGQTGDGSEDNITTVGCSAMAACSDSNNGVSEDLCDQNHPENCVDVNSIPTFDEASFAAASAAAPDSLTIEIKLNGGTSGTARLYSVGTHLIPVQSK
ncbi:MAG TPA: hypothetical protein VGZ29_14545 [Terriglobia bacterium]|nr:hypothetical protein [Terriglobia bacterium]